MTLSFPFQLSPSFHLSTTLKSLPIVGSVIQKYWFTALRKSYPWCAIGVWAIQMPFTDSQTRCALYNRIHRAAMRLNYGDLSSTIAETALPQYWIF